MNSKLLIYGIFCSINAWFFLIQPSSADALTAIDKPCTKAEVVFARGSGSHLGDRDGEAARFFSQLENRIPSSITFNKYELGAESYGGYLYPAVAVNDWSFGNGIGAFISAGSALQYGDSVRKGVNELLSYLSQRHVKCDSAETSISSEAFRRVLKWSVKLSL